MKRALPEKPLTWSGSAKDDLLEFPPEVVDDPVCSTSVQIGRKPMAKPWKAKAPAFSKSSRTTGDAYRAVYTVRFAEASLCSALFPEEVPVRDPHGAERSARIHDCLEGGQARL